MNTIIQWNCRGLRANYNELLLLLNEYNPAIVCLQETFLKEDKNIRNYKTYNYINTDANRASGGSTIAVHDKIVHRSLSLQTDLQAVAISVTLNKSFSVCSLYIPPNANISIEQLNHLQNQLPRPYMILGDLNGHHTLWGCNAVNDKGRIIEQFIDNHELCILNSKSPTYLHPATGHYSSIDLTISDPSLYLEYEWKVDNDLHGSDHFPTILLPTENNNDENPSRWIFKKADWRRFESLCDERLDIYKFLSEENPFDSFVDCLLSTAEECIPKTKTNSHKSQKPWFNKECKDAINKRKQALRQFQAQPTHSNLENIKILRAKARKTINKSKRESWKNYISKLNTRTSSKTIWKMIKRIQGKKSSGSVAHLKNPDGSFITEKKNIANRLADTFSKHSSSDNYDPRFQKYKDNKEKVKLNFKSNNNEEYNTEFEYHELEQALKLCKDSATGPDEIHYQIIKHLPFTSLVTLLKLYNHIWTSGKMPDSWKEATVIPIPKPGKDNTNPGNYRPIALTSCLCKLFERMVNTRLVWFLEKNGLITNFQAGFRKQRSTTDQIVKLETYIRDAFIKKEHVVSIFFDLEKAYDTTWKYGIMKDLHDFGLRGNMPKLIDNFLQDRVFNVRLGSILSDKHEQEMGVPQGSVLSVTLFSIKINSIVKSISSDVDCSLYVDDFLICFRSKSMPTIERKLQNCLNKLQTWSSENGFKFSKTKTQCVHFCQQRKAHDEPMLYLGETPIPVVKESKFLGVIFDNKLSFIPHLKYLKDKCLKAMNVLKVVSNTTWGADSVVLLRLYRSLIRSKLDYGCIVYGSARKSYIQMLDQIHHQALRICLGAYRTSPKESLYVEANEPSLYDRREKLTLQYVLKLKSNKDNPTYKCIFHPLYKDLYEIKPKAIRPLGLRIENSLQDLQVDLNLIHPFEIPSIPPWSFHQPNVDFSLHEYYKQDTIPLQFQSEFNNIKLSFPDYYYIYTDGSKISEKVACAATSVEHTSKSRLPDHSSIFSAEAKAIQLALDIVKYTNYNSYLIFSDSLSVLQSLKEANLNNPLIQNILISLTHLSETNNISFCWIPSHVGILGNDRADRAAKDALNLSHSNFKIPYSDYKTCIKSQLNNTWQKRWDDLDSNKLREIKPKIGPSKQITHNRKENTILTRLRIGHTRITHSFLLNNEIQPLCVACDAAFTVKHFLLHCIDLDLIRQNHFNVPNLYDLFGNVNVRDIINFLHESNLYWKI